MFPFIGANTLTAGIVTYDNGIFAYGISGGLESVSNLVSNTGVIATDTSGVGTARSYLGSCSYN